jgi:hypothetical protein
MDKVAMYKEMIYESAYNIEKDAISYEAFKRHARDAMINAYFAKEKVLNAVGDVGDKIIGKYVAKPVGKAMVYGGRKLASGGRKFAHGGANGFTKEFLDKMIEKAIRPDM